MTKSKQLLLLALLTLIFSYFDGSFAVNLNKYLEHKADIINKARSTRETHNLYNINLETVNNIEGTYNNQSYAKIINFFKSQFVLFDKKLYNVSSKMELFEKLQSSNIKFAKQIQYNNYGVILTVSEGVSEFFIYNNATSKMSKIQTIKIEAVSDAEFFINYDQLYLIMSTIKNDHKSPTIIYKFTGSHFDEISTISTSGAVKITTFPNNNAEIILILQDTKLRRVPSIIYEFKGEKLRKIQKFTTFKPKTALSYVFRNQRYIAILNFKEQITIYRWRGHELQSTGINKFEKFDDISVIYSYSNPFLIATDNVSLNIYQLTNSSAQIINKLDLSASFQAIWDIKFDKSSEITTIVGKKNASDSKLTEYAIKITQNQPAELKDEDALLLKCFTNLEKKLYKIRNDLKILRESNSQARQSDNSDDLSAAVDSLSSRLSNMKEAIGNYGVNPDLLIINGTAIMKDVVTADKITAVNVNLNKLNGKIFKPEELLSRSAPQIIRGPVKINNVTTKIMNRNIDDGLFNAKGNQRIKGAVSVENLKSAQLSVDSINKIPTESIYYRSKPVLITGPKIFNEIHVNNAKISKVNGFKAPEIMKLLTNPELLNHRFAPDLRIDNIIVENINGINFDVFRDSVFRLGVDKKIHGNLTFTNLESGNLLFDTINGHREFLTTSTDQEIKSDIFINRIFSHSIRAEKVNGIEEFDKAVALTTGSLITGPVKVHNLKIRNDLKMSDDIDPSDFLQHNEHIVGTNESDFIQQYRGTVKIKGNLIIDNIRIKNISNIVISGRNFTENFRSFWSKSLDQTIPRHFEAQNGIYTSHLSTKLLNQIDINDFMISNKNQKHTKYYFESVIINGSLRLNHNEHHSPDLHKISENSVKVNGSFDITGRKVFKDELQIEKLKCSQINGQPLASKKDTNNNVANSKSLIVKGDLLTNLHVDNINDIFISDLLNSVIYIDRNESIESLQLVNISAQNLNVDAINNIGFNDYIQEINTLRNVSFIDNLVITNNIKLSKLSHTSTINGLQVDEILQRNPIIEKLHFKNKINVKNLRVVKINGHNFTTLTRRVLYKKYKQTFSKPISFQRLKTNNLIAEQINNITLNFIDVSKADEQIISAPNNLIFMKSKIAQLNVSLQCDLHEALKRLKNPQTRLWENVIITGNVTFLDPEAPLKNIFDNAFVLNEMPRVISAPVNFTKHISANSVKSLKNINDIDMQSIIDDALLINSDKEQIISGEKMFTFMSSQDIEAKHDISVNKINKIDVKHLDERIISPNSDDIYIIRGRKTFFGGLQVNRIQSETISNVNPENFVSTANLKQIPWAIFENIDIFDNLFINTINDLSFDEFMSKRLLINSSQQYTNATYIFRNLLVKGNISTTHINDIDINKIVFDNDLQIISSPKTFLNDLKIIGDIKVDLVNGFKLSESFVNAVIQEDTIFNGNMEILSPSNIFGNITTKYLNNVPFSYMIDTMESEPLTAEGSHINEMINKISKIIHKYFNSTTKIPTAHIFLEKSSDLQISVSDTLSAQVVETSQDVLIHIGGEEDGNFCGLPVTCKCPVQQTIQITGENSVNMFVNKGHQRIYTYADDRIIIHFITNSISTSAECSTNMTKVMPEVSYLTWNLAPQVSSNKSGGFFMKDQVFTGYISGVEFFNIFGKVYVIVGRYYDPVLDSHALDCTILRFNQEMNDLEEIQKIPTEGMWTMSLIHTAQGVILIIGGSKRSQDSDINTKIMRFNSHSEEFELLREVPSFKALSAVGVVLGFDSLLILANKNSKLNVFKYNDKHDNYFFYQNFVLEDPIYSMSVFYSGDFGISDAYLSVVTKNSKYYIYSFEFIEGWKLVSSGEVDGIKGLIPFKLNGKSYLFAPSSKMSSLLSLVEHDSN